MQVRSKKKSVTVITGLRTCGKCNHAGSNVLGEVGLSLSKYNQGVMC